MTNREPIPIANFSHICVGVSDIDRSLAFYTGVLGMDVVFDIELQGAGLETVTGGSAGRGRMIGGLIGGTMVELLSLGAVPAGPEGPHLGYTNMSFRVDSVEGVHTMLQGSGDVRFTAPVDIGGVRMMFLYDPDRTPIELIELPGGATTTDQMWRAPADQP
jgi:catechol 2,3-dioxygenase-like lactoylglutathione lyase family enzyme